jgi:hypothetical protein
MNEHQDTKHMFADLPPHLSERCRVLTDRPVQPDREMVLYWMHHAVRGHENPALDVAVSIANPLRLPVLVYQGLGGGHPYDNDRHHTFILEGALDAHRELRERGIRAVFHLDRQPGRPSPLRRLVKRAAALVVEDYPAPPFPAWTRRLAERSATPVIAVDCFCVVPMQSQPKRFERAFEFRRHNQTELERRVPLPWTDSAPERRPFDGDLGFDPLGRMSLSCAPAAPSTTASRR